MYLKKGSFMNKTIVLCTGLALISGLADLNHLPGVATFNDTKVFTGMSIAQATSPILVKTPYVKSSEIQQFLAGYSNTEDCPWQFESNAYHFQMVKNAGIQASGSGRIIEVISQNDDQGFGIIIVQQELDNELYAFYGFMTGSKGDSDLKKQLQAIKVKKGQSVKAGDAIGPVQFFGKDTKFIFGLQYKGEFISPEAYLSSSVMTSLKAQMEKSHKGWPLAVVSSQSSEEKAKQKAAEEAQKSVEKERKEKENSAEGSTDFSKDMSVRDAQAKFYLGVPYQNAAEIKRIDWTYSEKFGNQPFGNVYSDMKFMPEKDLAAFVAASDGIVENIYAGKINGYEYNRGVRVTIRLDSKYVLHYTFNTSAAQNEVLEKQLKEVAVFKGQAVKKGQLIGRLIQQNINSNCLFSLAYLPEGAVMSATEEDKRQEISAEPYFDEAARKALLEVINKGKNGWKLAYYTINPPQEQISVIKDNQYISLKKPPKVINHELWIGLSDLKTLSGAVTSYDPKTGVVKCRVGPNSVQLKTKSLNAIVNGKATNLSAAPTVINGEPYVPATLCLSTFLYQNGWDEGSKLLNLTTKGFGGEYNRVEQTFSLQNNSAHNSMIALYKDHLYLGTTDFDIDFAYHENQKFFKLDLNMNLVWSYDLKGMAVCSAPSFDSEGNIYFATISKTGTFVKDDPSGKTLPTQNQLVSLTNDGKFRWSKVTSKSWNTTNYFGQVGCAVSKDDVIYLGDSQFFAFDKNGNELWHYPGSGEKELMPSRQTPLIDPAGNVYFFAAEMEMIDLDKRTVRKQGTSKVYCFKAGSGGTLVWSAGCENEMGVNYDSCNFVSAGPAFTKNYKNIVFATGDTVCSVKVADGTVNWKLKPFVGYNGVISASVLVDNQDNIYVNTKCDDSSTIYAIKSDGSGLLWKSNAVGSDLYCTGAIGDDNTLYIGSEPQIDTNYTFNAIDLKTGKLKWRIADRSLYMVNWTNVLIKDGYAYLVGNAPELLKVSKIKIDAKGYQKDAPWPCFRGSNVGH